MLYLAKTLQDDNYCDERKRNLSIDSMKSLNSSMQTAVIPVLTTGAYIVLTRTFTNVVNFLLIIEIGFSSEI